MPKTREEKLEYFKKYRKANLAYYAEKQREYYKEHPRDYESRRPTMKSNYLYKISISYERAVKDLLRMNI
jgi:hypothetical protein